MTMRVGLVGCVATKTSEPRPARDLYVSALFRGRRRYVERSCDRWFILSAKHGLVEPERVLEPYDDALADVPTQVRRRWSELVLADLRQRVGRFGDHTFEIHAGGNYRNFGLVAGLRAAGANVEVPTEGLDRGKQLAFYKTTRALESDGLQKERPQQMRTRAGVHPRAKGRSLADFLASAKPPQTLSFAEMERIIGRALPPSARRHRAWWANSPSQTLARQWLAAGWRADTVDLGQQWIRLTR